jgi:hypothetical protein
MGGFVAKSKQVARFAIGNETGACSEVWTCWANGSDFYMTANEIKGAKKISFHSSGICQYALLENFFAKVRNHYGRKDRTVLRWRRPPTPDRGPLLVAYFVFAAFETWEPFWEIEDKPITLLAPPEHGWARVVNVVYSREDPDNHCGGTPPEEVYIARFKLANGDFVTLIPGLVELPRGFFDEQPIPDVPIFSKIDPAVTDARNIAVLIPALHEPDGPLRVSSLHNMRMRTIPIEQYERERQESSLLAKLRGLVRKS